MIGDFPVGKFYFMVIINGLEIACSEVTGLDHEYDKVEYRAGSEKQGVTQKRLGLMKTGKVTIKKGISHFDPTFLGIYDLAFTNIFYNADTVMPRLEVIIMLLDENSLPVVTWDVHDAIPVKLTGTDLKSQENAIAFESLELEHSGVFAIYT